MLKKRNSRAPQEVVLERKRQFEAVCPQMLEVGEVLAAPALEDLIPAGPVYARSGSRALPTGCGCRAQKAAAGA